MLSLGDHTIHMTHIIFLDSGSLVQEGKRSSRSKHQFHLQTLCAITAVESVTSATQGLRY